MSGEGTLVGDAHYWDAAMYLARRWAYYDGHRYRVAASRDEWADWLIYKLPEGVPNAFR